jgi:hypothetical protein
MPGPLRSLAEVYRFNNGMLNTTVEGFTPEDWTHRPGEGISDARWILGHVIYERRILLRALGRQIPEEAWEKMFRMGTKPEDVVDPPATEDMVSDFLQAGEQLFERLSSLTEAEAEAEWAEFPQGSSSKSAGAHFLFLHECYHLGQLGLIRRLRGKSGIV